MKLNRFKFTVGPGLFREYTQLCSSLDEALLKLDEFAALGLVPGGHAPCKPLFGRPANETSPPRPDLIGRPWEVIEVYTYRDGGTSETWLAAFSRAADAFAFAELKTQLAHKRGDRGDAFFVALLGWAEDGRRPELARMPSDHLIRLRNARERGRKHPHARAA